MAEVPEAVVVQDVEEGLQLVIDLRERVGVVEGMRGGEGVPAPLDEKEWSVKARSKREVFSTVTEGRRLRGEGNSPPM